jgi:basic amino acid/polyamine antiporter, APA family
LAYISINIAMLHVLPASEAVDLGKYSAGTLFGEFGGRLISVGILVSIFGMMNGFILTSPQVPYAMALRGQLPASRLLPGLMPVSGRQSTPRFWNLL